MKVVVLLLTLFCWLTCTTFGSAQGGVIRGKVRAASGAALARVLVELWRSGVKTAQTVTTSEGDSYFTGLPPANYEIIVKHDNYQTAVERVALHLARGARGARAEGRTKAISVEIMLRPKSLPPATF